MIAMLHAKLKKEGDKILTVHHQDKKIDVEIHSLIASLELLPLLRGAGGAGLLDQLKEAGYEVNLKKSFLNLQL